MTEKLILPQNNIPDGILHDQDLYSVSLDDNTLTLSFETHLFPDHKGNEFCERYKDFTKCHIKCRFENEFPFDSCAELKTTADSEMEYKVKMVSISEFAELANAELKKRKKKPSLPWEYLYTYTSNVRNAVIELSIQANYRGTEYTMCTLQLTTDEIEYIWE